MPVPVPRQREDEPIQDPVTDQSDLEEPMQLDSPRYSDQVPEHVYHETQADGTRQCAIHAINMFLQAPCVKYEELMAFAMQYGASYPKLGSILYSTQPGDGHFNPLIISAYLKDARGLIFKETIAATRAEYSHILSQPAARAIVLRDGQHATAFATVKSVLYYLDSEAQGPQAVTDQLYDQLICKGANRVWVEQSDHIAQAVWAECSCCEEYTTSGPIWQTIKNGKTQVFVTLCEACDQDLDLRVTLSRKLKGASMLQRPVPRPSKPTALGQLRSTATVAQSIRGSEQQACLDAEHAAAHILHELLSCGNQQPRLPGCAVCGVKEKRCEQLQCVGEGDGLRLFCEDCYIKWDDTEDTIQEYIQSQGKPECAACGCCSNQRKRCSDTETAVLLCPTCDTTWSQRLDIPSGYAVGICMKEFVRAKGKPTVPTRDGKFIRPGDYVGHVRYLAPQGSTNQKGGAYWDIGRVIKVIQAGSMVEFEDYEEVNDVRGSKRHDGTFEHWRSTATGNSFEAPVSELIVLTCQEHDENIIVETTHLWRVAHEVEKAADRARRKRSASALKALN
jgi:hypothetical protein